MTTPPSQPQPLPSERIHRRETLWQIILPVAGGTVLFALLFAAVFLIPQLLPYPEQVSMVADVLVILFMLTPVLICLVPVYLLFMIMAFGMGAFNQGTANQLRRLHRLSQTITDQTITATNQVNQQAANLRVKLAGVEDRMEQTFRVDESEKPDDGTNDTTNPQV